MTSPRTSAESSGGSARRHVRSGRATRFDAVASGAPGATSPTHVDAELADDVLPRDPRGAVRCDSATRSPCTLHEIAAAPRPASAAARPGRARTPRTVRRRPRRSPGSAPHQRLRVLDQAGPSVERADGVGRSSSQAACGTEADATHTSTITATTGHAATADRAPTRGDASTATSSHDRGHRPPITTATSRQPPIVGVEHASPPAATVGCRAGAAAHLVGFLASPSQPCPTTLSPARAGIRTRIRSSGPVRRADRRRPWSVRSRRLAATRRQPLERSASGCSVGVVAAPGLLVVGAPLADESNYPLGVVVERRAVDVGRLPSPPAERPATRWRRGATSGASTRGFRRRRARRRRPPSSSPGASSASRCTEHRARSHARPGRGSRRAWPDRCR